MNTFSFLHKKLLSLALLLISAFCAPKISPGANQPLTKVRIAYSAISGSQIPAWVAYEQGFFRKYGLDTELIFVEGGSRTVQTLVSEDVVAAQVAGSSVIHSNLQGSGVVLIAGFLNTMDYKLIVARDITRPDQLKGKAMAVSRAGSSSDFATRFALDKYGLEPNKDVNILQIGSQPARFAALEAGKIQGAMIAVPLTLQAKKLGFNTLADLQMLGLEYQHTGLAVTKSLISSQPELVANILRAFVEGIHFYKTHRKESLEILRKYLKTDDSGALEETYEAVGLTLIPDKPYPTLRGIDIMLKEMASKEPKARMARPEQFVDLRFIKELDESGFIQRLGKTIVAKAPHREVPQSLAVKESVTKGQAAEANPAEQANKLKADAKREKQTESATRTPSSSTPAKERTTAVAAKPFAAAHVTKQEYTIKAGDTLSKLAHQFYDDPLKWPHIFDANKETVKNPNYIFIGQKILIPPTPQTGA